MLFTLLVQGTTIGPILRRLNIIQSSQSQPDYGREQARNVATRAAYDRLETIFRNGAISQLTWETVSPISKTRADEASQTAHRLLSAGMISEEIYAEIVSSIDMALDRAQIDRRELEDMKIGLGIAS